uniref:DUF5677 domain-containing protein n=1 Tax=Methylobacterium oryzae TaxID=334852 RepID=UPI00155D9EEE|nr:hypothetical protein [Methylobacterium oryzae]
MYDTSDMTEKQIKKFLSASKEFHVLRTSSSQFVIKDNLLRNFIDRDIAPVTKSFDKIYLHKLTEIDALFSETAFLFFVAHKRSAETDDKYNDVFIGLIQNALNTFGSAVILLRSGLPGQCMVLLRQAVEICSTIIHIAGDPKATAIDKFIDRKYRSTDSIGEAKKAVPIIGHLWGFLSNEFVHITYTHTAIHPVRPYKDDNGDVEAVIKCLRMTVWICYLTAEIAFPAARERNRYWQRRKIDGRYAVEYAPTPEERKWAAKFLDLEDVGPDDLDGSNNTPDA